MRCVGIEASRWGQYLQVAGMALFWPQTALLTVQRLWPLTDGSTGKKISKSKDQGGLYGAQLLSLLVSSVEYSFFIKYHPAMPSDNARNLLYIPEDTVILAQIVIFCIADWAAYRFLQRYYPLFSVEEPATASSIATEFTVVRATLLVGITLVQGRSYLGFTRRKNHLHFLAMAGWTFLRQLRSVVNGQSIL